MPRRPKPFSEQLRAAILNAGKTRYRIAKETGVTQASLSRFVNGAARLSLDSIDKIGECLHLEIVARDQPAKRAKSKRGK